MRDKFAKIDSDLKQGRLDLGNVNYARSLIYSVHQALLCKLQKISLIELGVASGAGLLSLSRCAQYFSENFDIDIEIFGFDTGVGMPPSIDYRDHPELWSKGDFVMDPELKNNLPKNTKLILGDVKNTIPDFVSSFNSTIAFVSIDLDLYSSTVNSMPLFEMSAENYLPALPVYVDNINTILSYNQWCGEALALAEFNQSHNHRKFVENHRSWGIDNLYTFHVFDHPFRLGLKTPPNPLFIYPNY